MSPPTPVPALSNSSDDTTKEQHHTDGLSALLPAPRASNCAELEGEASRQALLHPREALFGDNVAGTSDVAKTVVPESGEGLAIVTAGWGAEPSPRGVEARQLIRELSQQPSQVLVLWGLLFGVGMRLA